MSLTPARFCFSCLQGGALFTYLGFTAVQEGVFRTADFKYSGMVTLCTSSIYCISAGLERVRNGEGLTRKGSWRDYIILALMTSTGMYMTNAALMYLNYTTRIVAKSSKVIPTMILGTVMQGRRYNVDEYSAAGLLVLGIILFTMGDVESLPSFNPKGVVLIMIALCLDSAAGNFEERRFFNVPNPVSHAEVVYHANLIGMCFTVMTMFASGELFEALHHAVTHTADPTATQTRDARLTCIAGRARAIDPTATNTTDTTHRAERASTTDTRDTTERADTTDRADRADTTDTTETDTAGTTDAAEPMDLAEERWEKQAPRSHSRSRSHSQMKMKRGRGAKASLNQGNTCARVCRCACVRECVRSRKGG